MGRLVLSLLTFFVVQSFAASGIKYMDLAQTPALKIEFYSVKGIRLSANCRGQSKCTALLKIGTASAPSAIQVDTNGRIIPPASTMCNGLDGHMVILTDSYHNQHAFCRFADNSYFSPDDWLAIHGSQIH